MKKWRINRPDPVKTAEFMNKCDLKSLTLDVMTSRGFTDFDSLADFFKGEELSDPFLIKDMAIAAEVINKAVDQYDLICIYGDYDCDGVKSFSSPISRAFRVTLRSETPSISASSRLRVL